MRYVTCKICGAVAEGLGYNAGSKIYDHIHQAHPEIFEEIREDEERHRQEVGKVKDALSIGSFMIFEDMPKKDGRKEHEGHIINI